MIPQLLYQRWVQADPQLDDILDVCCLLAPARQLNRVMAGGKYLTLHPLQQAGLPVGGDHAHPDPGADSPLQPADQLRPSPVQVTHTRHVQDQLCAPLISAPILNRTTRIFYIEEGFVAAAWRAECLKFYAALAILHQDDWKNGMKCTRTVVRIGWSCKSSG